MMYDDLVKKLRYCGNAVSCIHCPYWEGCGGLAQAADAIEELLKAAKAMHTWIFLNSGEEQVVYDECGLSDEMNVALGYGGQIVAEMPKEELVNFGEWIPVTEIEVMPPKPPEVETE